MTQAMLRTRVQKRSRDSADSVDETGRAIYDLLAFLHPIHCGIMGAETRQFLQRIAGYIPLHLTNLASGVRLYDWIVPDEWRLKSAFISDSAGHRVLDGSAHALHVVGYSSPVNFWLSLDDLQPHLHSDPRHPQAIPYVPPFAEHDWGFCLPHQQRMKLRPGMYRVVIDAVKTPGHLQYGECLMPGRSQQEIVLTAPVGYPCMANAGCSGAAVLTFLARWLASRPRRYSYRIVFTPAGAGAVAFLSQNMPVLKQRMVAGFQLHHLGAAEPFRLLESRRGDTFADRVLSTVLRFKQPNFRQHDFMDGHGDERYYASPGMDLPLATLMRADPAPSTADYSSMDDLFAISPQALQESFYVLRDSLELIERNETYELAGAVPPPWSEYGMSPHLFSVAASEGEKLSGNLLSLADGKHDVVAMAQRLGVPPWRLYPAIDGLLDKKLLQRNATHFMTPFMAAI